MNTSIHTNTRTRQLLKVMLVLTWIAFVGLMIQPGALLVSYVVGCIYPEAIPKMYKGLDNDTLRQFSFRHYSLFVFFRVALSVMKAFVLYLAIKAMSEVNLVSPFKLEMVRILERISYVLFGTWIIATLHNMHTGWLLKRTGVDQDIWPPETFIFMAGVVFIISQIFKRGVELQSENDLTV